MSLRVLDDDPGFAVLRFDKQMNAAQLEISVLSLSEEDKGYLGPGGQWRKTPHFFVAERLDPERGWSSYRVGPEVVNYLEEHTRIEIATRSGDLRETTIWQNAVPQMSPGGAVYAFQSPSNASSSIAAASAPSRELGETRTGGPGAPPPPPPPPPPPSPTSKAVGRGMWRIAAPLALLALVAGVLSSSLPCALLGLGCPPDGGLAKAIRCANEALPGNPCAVETCFIDYRRSATPTGEAASLIERGRAGCAPAPVKSPDKKQGYADAKACVDRQPCVAEACFQNYRSMDLSAAEQAQVSREIAAAKGRCQPTAPNPSGGGFNFDGVYSAYASPGCGAPGQNVTVTITGGAISFRHNMPLVPGGPAVTGGWEGSIGPDGDIRASVAGLSGFTASGRLSSGQIMLRGATCRSGEAVTLHILQKRPSSP